MAKKAHDIAQDAENRRLSREGATHALRQQSAAPPMKEEPEVAAQRQHASKAKRAAENAERSRKHREDAAKVVAPKKKQKTRGADS